MSTSSIQFQIHPDGTIADNRSGLLWARCSLGQTWNGKSCFGTPTSVNWLQAFDNASNANLANRSWRLPSISELSSIVELHCENPAINLDLFPGTQASHYWTATAFTKQANSHWLLQFRTGENHTDKNSSLAFVRLVSD